MQEASLVPASQEGEAKGSLHYALEDSPEIYVGGLLLLNL
jgi:hypothetical protein